MFKRSLKWDNKCRLFIIVITIYILNTWNRSYNHTFGGFNLTSDAENYLKRDMIFIIGSKSSGTSLLQDLLNLHPDINCGDDTVAIPKILNLVGKRIFQNPAQVKFLSDFGVKNDTLEKATGLFIYYVMEKNKKNFYIDPYTIKYLCNKGLNLFIKKLKINCL